MGKTILVAVLAFLLAGAAVLAFFIFRKKHGGDLGFQGFVPHDKVNTVSSVGVSSSHNTENKKRSSSVANDDSKAIEGLRPRFVALGVLSAAIFGSLAAKLWSMQILTSEEYKQKAKNNKFTTVSTPAPRGYIYDADGLALVRNRSALAVLAEADVLENQRVIRRLSAVLGIPYNIVRIRLQDTSSGAQGLRMISYDSALRDVAYIAEHSDAFPGVVVQSRSIREYPFGALASHVVGYTGPISEEEVSTVHDGRDLKLGDDVGKSGIEARYDSLLSGDHGLRTVIADSHGKTIEVVSETHPKRGSDVYLTIKASAQYAAEEALKNLIAPDGVIGKATGVAGAVVAMDVRDGSILTMASYPTFSPETFLGGISQDTWDLYSSDSSYYPLLNRAIAGAYPAASTFKAFTSLAGLKYGFADESKTWNCQGSWDGFESGDIQKCWLHSGHGNLDLHDGIAKSCDVVFYEIAKDFFYAGASQGGTLPDTAMQDEIERYGFGTKTGIDLAGEEEGRIPTPEWKAKHWADVPTEGRWVGGDLSNMVIGQGDVLVTPLQMAVAYGAIATGNLMRPHLLKEVKNEGADTPAITYEPELISHPDVDQEYLNYVRTALGDVLYETPALVSKFESVGLDPAEVGCKTGTGEVAGKVDYAWFVCYMPFDDPKYVVSVVVEQGGGGSRAAGPIGADVMAALFKSEEAPDEGVGFVAGSSGISVDYHGASSGRTD